MEESSDLSGAAIGNTPLVELTNLTNRSPVKIFVKREGSNPGGR